jgi:hypothetical protein
VPDVRINLGLVFIRIVASTVGLAGRLAVIEGRRNAKKVMLGKREGKRTLGGPGHRWEGNIKWI